jgi:hypothetical protein
MNIIFDQPPQDVKEKFVVLELDTFSNNEKSITAYCVVDQVPLQDFPTLAAYVETHENLMQEYKKQNWEYCLCAIKELTGRWNGELDSFYENLLGRVNELQANPPGDTWDHTLFKNF